MNFNALKEVKDFACWPAARPLTVLGPFLNKSGVIYSSTDYESPIMMQILTKVGHYTALL